MEVHSTVTDITFLDNFFNIQVVAPRRICNVLVVLILCMITWSPLPYFTGKKEDWLFLAPVLLI